MGTGVSTLYFAANIRISSLFLQQFSPLVSSHADLSPRTCTILVIIGFLRICSIKNNDNSRIVIRTPTIFVTVGTFEVCDIKNGDNDIRGIDS